MGVEGVGAGVGGEGEGEREARRREVEREKKNPSCWQMYAAGMMSLEQLEERAEKQLGLC